MKEKEDDSLINNEKTDEVFRHGENQLRLFIIHYTSFISQK